LRARGSSLRLLDQPAELDKPGPDVPFSVWNSAPGGAGPSGGLPDGASTISHLLTSLAKAAAIEGAAAPARPWVMITSVASVGWCVPIVKRVWPALVCCTSLVVACSWPGPCSCDTGVNQGCLQVLPGGRYWTTARMPTSRSLLSRPAASSR